MRQRVRVGQVRLGSEEYRVLRFDPPPPRAFLFDDMGWAQAMYVDRDAAATLAAAWGLAARSRHSLVHLPMRANDPPEGVARDGLEPLDLVLVHHSLQFPPSRWPAVRARLGRGRLQAVTLPDDVFPGPESIDYDRTRYRENRDHLRFDLAARTLFLTGSSEAFRRTGSQIRSLTAEAVTAYLTRWPKATHYCVEIDAVNRDRGGRLHIEYNDAWCL